MPRSTKANAREGMDWSALRLGGDGGFDIAGLKQEEIVNGIKQLALGVHSACTGQGRL